VTISDLELETRLRDLRARADDIPPAPADLARTTRERYRAERRRRIALSAAGLVAALVFVGLPVAVSGLADGPARGETARPSRSAPAVSPELYDLAPRGSLADDQEWLDGVRALSWVPAEPVDPNALPPGVLLPDPAAASRRVAFAGDVPSGRIALVLGMDGNSLAHAWFVGDRGADPDEMVLATLPSLSSTGQALTLIDAPSPESDVLTLVVVALPGDTATRAVVPVVFASGEVSEERVPIPMDDGIGVAEIEAPWPWILDLWIDRAGAFIGSIGDRTDRAAPPDMHLWPEIPPADPRGLVDRTQRDMAEMTIGTQLSRYGLTAEQARPTLLAAGPLGTYVGTYGELYGFTFPSGAIGGWVVSYTPGRVDASSQQLDLRPMPAGAPLLDRVIAVQVSAGLLVSAPGGVTAEALDRSGAVLTSVPLERGAGSGPLNDPGAVTVRIRDAAGTVVAEAPIERFGR
jgi:hypothetical protein